LAVGANAERENRSELFGGVLSFAAAITWLAASGSAHHIAPYRQQIAFRRPSFDSH